MVRNSVLLPAPLLPTSATMSPLLDREIDAAQHADMAVADIEAGDLQQRRRSRCRLPDPACDPM